MTGASPSQVSSLRRRVVERMRGAISGRVSGGVVASTEIVVGA